MKQHDKIRRIALMGILTAAALSLSYLESVLTALLPLPPGVKPGLANVIITLVCVLLGFVPALLITLLKSAFVFTVSGVSGGIISLAGGVCGITCTAFMLKLKNKHPKTLSYAGVSVMAAVCNNAGQLTAASLLVGSFLYMNYAPVLLVSAVVFGGVTGSIVNAGMKMGRLEIR